MKLFAILSLFIVSLVLTTSNFSYIPFLKGTAYAANSMYLEQSKKEVKTGETVNVTVKASIDNQFNTAQVDVAYTKETLKLQTVKVGDALPQVAFEQTDPGLVSYSLYKIGGASGQELTLLTLSFENLGGTSEVSFNKTSRLLEAGKVVAYGAGTVKISTASVVTQSKVEPVPEAKPEPEPTPVFDAKPEIDPLPKPVVKTEAKTTPLPEPAIEEEPKEIISNSTEVKTNSAAKKQNATSESSVVTKANTNDNSEQDSANSNVLAASTPESTTTSDTQTTESNTATNSESTEEKTSEELPNTGPGNMIGLTGLVTIIGYLLNNLRLKFSLRRI